MDSIQISKVCNKFCKYFLGCFPCDRLPTDVNWPSCLIANTEPHYSTGEHWIAIFINKEGYADFFCSMGSDPQSQFKKFLDTYSFSWNQNKKQVQNNNSISCGQYCIFFLFVRTYGISLPKFLTLFTSNYEENDEIVTGFVNGKFNISSLIYE